MSTVAQAPLIIPDCLWQTDLYWAEVYGISHETLNGSWAKTYKLEGRKAGNRTLYHRDEILLKVFGVQADAKKKTPKPKG